MEKKKCSHKNDKYKCRICNPNAFCDHNKYKYTCSICNPNFKNHTIQRIICIHEKRKDSCVKCFGCVHNKLICIICNPNHFCEHKKRTTCCFMCKGGAVCEHEKIRSKCILCSGHNFCDHKKLINACIECCHNKISFCVHEKFKWNCVECNGSQICIHKKRKRYCKECDGSGFCVHKKQKSFCKECKGVSICQHNIRRYDCKICSPEKWLIGLIRQNTRRVLKIKTKDLPTHDYLGCDSKYFIEYIDGLMKPEMTYENIHIDHIKPVSKFDLSDIENVKACCHWSNLQPLLSTDNLKKSNKWTEKNEIEWKNNISKYKIQQTGVGGQYKTSHLVSA